MKKLKYILFIALPLLFFNSCVEDNVEFKYVTFESATYEFGVPIAGNATKGIKVYTSQIMKSDRTFQVQVVSALSNADPVSYVVPTSVTIPANSNEGVLDVKVSDVNIGSTGKVLYLGLVNDEEYNVGGNIKLNLSQICTQNDVRLNITLDGWGSETTWKLFNSTNTLIASGGPYADGSTAVVTTKFCLPSGTYTFIIYDAWGDGLTATASGKAQIVMGTTTLVNIAGIEFVEETRTFTLP